MCIGEVGINPSQFVELTFKEVGWICEGYFLRSLPIKYVATWLANFGAKEHQQKSINDMFPAGGQAQQPKKLNEDYKKDLIKEAVRLGIVKGK